MAALAVAAADAARGARAGPAPGHPGWRHDPRVPAVARALAAGPGWRRCTLEEVARRLAGALGAEEERALWSDLERGRAPDPPR
ncbi:hypothetical protein ACI8AC_13055 [Geodermatophilus sp. SYSU D00758]